MNKIIGISAQNIKEGGPLTILKIFLKEIQKKINHDHKVKVYVYLNNKDVLNLKDFDKEIFKFFFLPNSTKNYFYKLYYQLFFFKRESLIREFNTWISLQDIAPNVLAKKKITYFHTPIIFHKMNLKEIFFEPTSFLRSIFFKLYLNQVKQKKIIFITQQKWIKKLLKEKFGIQNIIVSKPEISKKKYERKLTKKIIFLYPSLPRFQKNYEVICKACKKLKNKNLKYEILFTFDKNENRYSKYIYNISKNIENIKLIGRQNYYQMQKLYKKSNFLIFSSKLETWGLPLSEAVSYDLPILASNYDYVRETVGNYKKIKYFDPDNHKLLSNILYDMISNKKKFKKNKSKTLISQDRLNFPWDHII